MYELGVKVIKVINNNIVSAIDQDGNEIVAMGRGLGFNKKPNQILAPDAIEKIFRIDNHDSMERFKNLLKGLPMEHLQLADEIISYAKEKLNTDLIESVYLTLTDHISFAINQCKEGNIYTNILHEEVRRFYADEYAVGMYGLMRIREKTGCRLPDDEAASIALHIINARFDMSVRDGLTMTDLMKEVVSIIESDLGIEDRDFPYRQLFTMNIKFLAHRLLKLPPDDCTPDSRLEEFAKSYYCDEYILVEKVRSFVKERYSCEMTEAEILHLVLDIGRLKDMYLK